MSTLTNTYISDTYLGILHAETQLPASGQAGIYDGNGTQSALYVGALNNGATISGLLKAAEFTYPTTDGASNDIVVTDGAKNLSLKSLTEIIASLGGSSEITGTYTNPRITLNNGVITGIVNVVTGGMRAITSVGANNTFIVPTDVYKLKFYVTGGGGYGGYYSGSAGATVIGYMDVVPAQSFNVIVAAAGTSGFPDGGTSQILYNNEPLVTAYGGINAGWNSKSQAAAARAVVTGATGTVSSTGLLFITSYSGSPSYVVVPGGLGLIDTANDGEGSTGGSSYWGNGPSFGGGSSSHDKLISGAPGNGVVIFEW